MRALVIIDMQKVFFTPTTPRYDAEGTISRIHSLSERFRANGDAVIFIQHDGSKEGYCMPHTDGWEIVPSLQIAPNDIIIAKTANDSFYSTSLNDVLKRLDVDELFVTGCATDFCVDATIKSAVTYDYHITVVSDGHTTGDRPHLSAKQAIAHYNWIWSEMTPTKSKIQVIDFKSIIKNI